MFALACPPDLARTARKITAAWTLWAAPTESRGADPDEDGKRRSVGAVIGSPQKLAFVFEQSLERRFALQFHGGTNFDDHAAGGRVLVRSGPTNGVYGVVGAGAFTSGGWSGDVLPYLTAGAGVQVGTERLRFFGEAGPVMVPGEPGRNGMGLAFGVLGSASGETHGPGPDVDRRDSTSGWSDTRVSAFAGVPYLIGIGIEQRISEHGSVAFTAGSVVIATTATVRGIYGAQDGTGLYATGGGGIGLLLPTDTGGEWAGVFAMGGVGARWTDHGVGVFAELGGLIASGGGDVAPMMAAGFIFTP